MESLVSWILIASGYCFVSWLSWRLGHVHGWYRGIKDIRYWTRRTRNERENVIQYPTRILAEPIPSAWSWVRRQGWWR